MMFEAQKKRANPSARMSMLYSAFGDVSDASVEATPGPSATASWTDDISLKSANDPQAVQGLTAADHRQKARSSIIATWQMAAIPIFFSAERRVAKACAASLSEHMTMDRIVEGCKRGKEQPRCQ